MYHTHIAGRGMTYEDYMASVREGLVAVDPAALNPADAELHHYTALNVKRSARIEKTYTVSDGMRAAVAAISQPQTWMVITEGWCGDSAQILPHLAMIAACNPIIAFRVFLRDSNTDLMDAWLTNGTRSVPKLVAFSHEGEELFVWGPRPAEAQDLINHLKGTMPRQEMYAQLHGWYAKNRGLAIEQEFRTILTA